MTVKKFLFHFIVSFSYFDFVLHWSSYREERRSRGLMALEEINEIILAGDNKADRFSYRNEGGRRRQ